MREADRERAPTRRRALELAGAGALAAAAFLSAPAVRAQAARLELVVVGGGPGGVGLARRIARSGAGVAATLVTDRPFYGACFGANLYLAGLRSLRSITFDYRALEADGVRVVIDRAVGVDRDRRDLLLAGGARLPYDRLALAPGVDIDAAAIEGYGALGAEQAPHGYLGGYDAYLLKRRVEAMPAGGLFLLSPPPPPARAPLAVYERAAMLALAFQRSNPSATVLIADRVDDFPMRALFRDDWARRFPGRIEWLGAGATGGGVVAVDLAGGVAVTGDGGRIAFAAASISPPHRAGALAVQAGLVDASGWVPVAPETMRAAADPAILVLGDAAKLEPAPKTAALAASAAELAAAALAAETSGAPAPAAARLESAGWSHLGAHAALAERSAYAIDAGGLRETERRESDGEETDADRADASLTARRWLTAFTAALYG